MTSTCRLQAYAQKARPTERSKRTQQHPPGRIAANTAVASNAHPNGASTPIGQPVLMNDAPPGRRPSDLGQRRSGQLVLAAVSRPLSWHRLGSASPSSSRFSALAGALAGVLRRLRTRAGWRQTALDTARQVGISDRPGAGGPTRRGRGALPLEVAAERRFRGVRPEGAGGTGPDRGERGAA